MVYMDTSVSQPDALLSWMSSLADGTRLRLLRLLERHELGVADLCDVLQMPQSTVSRHLKVLADQGWVTSRRSGTTNLYRTILDELLPAARDLWVVARVQTEDWASVKQDQVRLQRRLRARRKEARDFFADVAADWERRRRELYGNRFDTHALLALLPGVWTVADLGCGSGAMTAQLAPNVQQVIGVDDSEPMLETAANMTADYDNVEFRQADLEDLPLETECCDAALMLLVLTYLPHPVRVLEEACRILRTEHGGGRLVLIDLLRHDREDFRRQMGQAHLGFGEKQLKTMLEDAGFSRAHVRPLEPEPEATGPALLLACADK